MKNHWLQVRENKSEWSDLEIRDCNNLNIYYAYQLVEDERTCSFCHTTPASVFDLQHSSIVPATMLGRVYCKNSKVVSFCDDEDGTFIWGPFWDNSILPIKGQVFYADGRLELDWNGGCPNHHIVVSYEFDHHNDRKGSK